MNARASIFAVGTALALVAQATQATAAAKPTNTSGCTLHAKAVRTCGIKAAPTTAVVAPYRFQRLRNAI